MQPTNLVVELLILLPLFCLCNGVQPRKKSYTTEEEIFIINEIIEYPSKMKPIHGTRMWKKIAEKHREMRKLYPTVFFQERTHTGLRFYFVKKMLKSKGKVHVPDTLLKDLSSPPENTDQMDSIPKDKVKNGIRLVENRYTPEEDRFLIEQVLKYPRSPVPIHGRKMWLDIEKLFQEKGIANPTQFSHERTGKALQGRFLKILKSKFKGQERNDLIERIKGRASKQNKVDDNLIEKKEIIPDDTTSWASMIEELQNNSAEIDFSKL